MAKANLRRAMLFLAVASGFLLLDRRGVPLFMLSEGRSLAAFLAVAADLLALYEVGVLIVGAVIRSRKGAPSEVGMLASLLRALAVVVIGLVFLSSLGKLTGSWAAVAGFAGLLMGWSLQAPVSGVAAWVFVNIKRPFRVGDRVLLPAWGLTGDVTSIGMMYTVLNQVGGTVGSEEAAGRNILIPNAMLFGNVVINYTPQQTAGYVLDEVVVRITYDSAWDLAEKVLLDAAREVTADIIKETGQEPYMRADMYDYGVYLRLRYMASAMDRPRIVYEITRRIFREFQRHPEIDFAIPFVFSHRTGLMARTRQLDAARAPETEPLDIDSVHDASGVAAMPENKSQVPELAKRIAELGLLQPIVVQRREDGQYNVIVGHLRLAACKLLGWKTIPAYIRPRA
jgi:small-conductance mechanosensitive channel